MSFTVAAGDLARLQAVLDALLSPLSEVESERWPGEVCRRLEELLGSGARATFFLSGPPAPTVVHSALPDDTLEAYVEHFGSMDEATRRILQRRIEVAHPWLVQSRPALYASEFYNDFVEPHGIPGMLALSSFEGATAGPRIVMVFPVEPEEGELEKGRALLATLVPAFRAGVDAWTRLAPDAASLAGALDMLEDSLLVGDESGRPLHRNVALVRLLSEEPERLRLEAEIEALARAAAALAEPRPGGGSVAAASREIVTGRGRYRAGACLVPEGLVASRRTVLVTIRPLTARPLDDADLRERFGLTRREIEVARLLDRGLSNAELARALFISPNTARIHVERVLRKLGAGRRSRVGPILRGEEEGGAAA